MSNLERLRQNATAQSDEGLTYARKVHKDAARVIPTQDTIATAYNKFRALQHIWVLVNHRRIRFSGFVPEMFSREDLQVPVGTIRYHNAVLQLRVSDGWIAFQETQRDSGKLLRVMDFVNGFMRSTNATLIAQ